MPPRKGIFGLVGTGVGMVAEYHEHRKERKLARGNSQQDETAVAGPSTVRPQPSARETSSPSDLPPPAYADVVDDRSERSLTSGRPAQSANKKAALSQYSDDESSSDSDTDSDDVMNDEEAWQLDEAISRREMPPYEDSEQNFRSTNDLAHEVISKTQPTPASFTSTPLPCPVILPQRRPRKKARGFVRAYPPLLGQSSGISQETFLTFLENFSKSAQASPIFDIISISAAIAGFAPSVIAMAVTTAVQVGAGICKEIQSRQRTNEFLDKMNEDLFKPAGLYAMIVKYKSEAEVQASGNSLLARLGVGGEKVDFNTNQTIAKYNRTLSEESSANRSMSDRMKNIRLASGTTEGAIQLPEAAPLIFPDIDDALAKKGPETFKDKAKDVQSFVGSYMDRRAHMEYARDDLSSSLAVPEEQRAVKSKLADPEHRMYNSGLVGFVSGGALGRDRMLKGERQLQRRECGDERRMLKYEQRMARGRGLSRKKERRYERMLATGSSRRKPRRDKQGIFGTVRKVMQEDVLYLMIVNMPSEAELAEAREALARAKGER
ncbi:hypothetical protein LTR37_007389 [Vermiconidia calcicola]|uniref:Uncharacterized protein n=1 Tax=Vermiconidia calcicola TaxID=1690605 RepID=A0ACC3NDT7_9PEZI|nr:hypothetical protein LTR37_007389 [Vermiconidia calcicola]